MTHYLRDRSGAALADDAELQRVTDYVGGFMSEAERAQFERDFANDEGFAHRVAPFLKIFYSPVRLPNADAARARIRARRERRAREAAIAPVESTAPPAIEAVVIDITPHLADRKRRRSPLQGVFGVAAAAALAFAILKSGQQEPAVHTRPTANNVTPPPVVPAPITATPVTAPVAKTTRKVVRKVAAKAPPEQVPVMQVVDDSLAAPLPATGFIPAKTLIDSAGAVAITVVASPLDTAALNAQERLREQIEREKQAAADKAAQNRRRLLPRIIGWVFGRRPLVKPPAYR